MKTISSLNRTVRGFSLIELIGVLAVLTILALALIPSLVKQYDLAANNSEAATVKQLAGGLQAFIIRTRTIPNTNDMPTQIASQLGLLLSDVSKNARGNPRVFLADPTLSIGTNTTSKLPYLQGWGGATVITNARILIITSLGQPLPSGITNAGASGKAMFDMLWSAADKTTPTGWTWGGNFADIRIQRLDLTPLFVPLTLNNNSPDYGVYGVGDNSNPAPLATNCVSASYIQSTLLSLYDSKTNLQTSEILQDTCAFVYEKGIWRGKLFSDPNGYRRTGADLQAAYDIFMAAPPNPGAKFGTTQAQVTGDMIRYMSNYIYWATNSFSSSKKPGLTSAQSAMASDSKNYEFKAGS